MTPITIPQHALILEGGPMTDRNSIEEMCQWITDFGLLNPLTVKPEEGRFVIVDGRKRFQAIKKLAKMNKLPRTLHKIPCVTHDSAMLSKPSSEKPLLLSEQDLVHEILSENDKGRTYAEISKLLDCSERVIAQARSLCRLHSKLMLAFVNNTIDLAQAAALSTLPNKEAQWDLLIQLGPFATEPEIIKAIANGETVLELPNGDVMILPSRAPQYLPAFQSCSVSTLAFEQAA